MLKNKTVNLEALKKVAAALGGLNDRVAFVGGAAVSLYADDPGAGDVRPTKDVDIILNIISIPELTVLQESLAQKGIHPDRGSSVVCRFKFEDMLIDVMSTKEVGWAPSDKWFAPGFKHLTSYRIDGYTTIQIFPVEYFLATKFSAYRNRSGDPRTSEDFEDIVYVLDNRLNIVNEIKSAPEDVRVYLKSELKELLKEEMNEEISCHLGPYSQEERLPILKEKIRQIVS